MFHLEIPFYSQFYKVIVFDYPGYGKSERLKNLHSYFWNDAGNCGFHLLDFLGIDKVKAIGTSGGALVGLNMAVLQPERITKLIADSFIGLTITIAHAERIAKNRRKAKSELLSSAFWKAQHGGDWEYVIDQDIQLFLDVAYSAMPTIQGKLENITANVMAVGSKEDELIDNIGDRMKVVTDRILNSFLLIFDQGKHPYMITKREEFRQIALEFLES
jgi:pimeloyl-ACP methyl ester carboxylesterase